MFKWGGIKYSEDNPRTNGTLAPYAYINNNTLYTNNSAIIKLKDDDKKIKFSVNGGYCTYSVYIDGKLVEQFGTSVTTKVYNLSNNKEFKILIAGNPGLGSSTNLNYAIW